MAAKKSQKAAGSRRPRSRRSAGNSGAPRHKRGNQGNFHGGRLDFLNNQLTDYLAAAKKKNYKPFWTRLFSTYWEKFPWWLPMDTEPTEENLVPPEIMTDDLVTQKTKVMAATNKSLKTFFRYRRSALVRGFRNPWDPLLKGLKDVEAVAPRPLPPWQHWMTQHPDAIRAEYERLHPDKTLLERSRDIHERCRIARQLFNALPLDQQEAAKIEAQAAYDKDVAEFELLQNTLVDNTVPTLDSQLRARESVADIIAPLLDSVAKYTGTATTLLLGSLPPPGEKTLYVKAIHSGTTKATGLDPGKTWSEYDPAGFREAGKLFSKFIARTDTLAPELYRMPNEEDEGTPLIANVKGDDDEDSENEDNSDSEESGDEDENDSGGDSSDSNSDEDEPLAKKHTQRKPKATAVRAVVARNDGELLERRWRACKISSTLRDSVEQLSGEERRQRMVDIVEADAFDLAREEQIASNRVLLQSIMAPVPPPPSSATPTMSRIASLPPNVRSVLSGAPPVPLPPSVAPPPAASSFPSVPLPPSVAPPLAASSFPSAPSISVPQTIIFSTVNPDNWPAWLNEAYTYLSDAQLGDDFEAVLVAWTELERVYEFETGNGLSTVNRPPQVAHWMRHLRRDFKKHPAIDDIAEYATQWWAWWTALQPEWRTTDANGRPNKAEVGGWAQLRRPGKNGIFLILLSLLWWKKVSTAEDDDWRSAVGDVHWVLSVMLIAFAAPATPSAVMSVSAVALNSRADSTPADATSVVTGATSSAAPIVAGATPPVAADAAIGRTRAVTPVVTAGTADGATANVTSPATGAASAARVAVKRPARGTARKRAAEASTEGSQRRRSLRKL